MLIKPSALGDVVHTIPVLVKLRARYPRARIDWLITPENAEVVRHHPALSNVVLFARRDFSKPGQRWRATLGFFDLLKQIRRAKYDLVVDMHGQVRSALFALISGARVRIGFDRPIEFSRTISAEHDLKNVPNRGWRGAREGSWIAYTHRIPIPTLDVHAIDRYLWVGSLLGFDDEPPDLAIHLSPETIRNVDRLLDEHGVPAGKPLVVLVPGTIWETKHWTIEGFAGVAREFLRQGFAVALAGTKRDEARCRQIAAAAPGTINLCGKTTPADLAGLIQRAEVAVTNDSGSMHVAASLGKPDGERIWPDESGSHRAVPKAGIGCARGSAVFALQLPSPEPMPFRSRLHEAGHVRDGRGARTENSRGGKTVACAVLSAGSLGAAQNPLRTADATTLVASETPG